MGMVGVKPPQYPMRETSPFAPHVFTAVVTTRPNVRSSQSAELLVLVTVAAFPYPGIGEPLFAKAT